MSLLPPLVLGSPSPAPRSRQPQHSAPRHSCPHCGSDRTEAHGSFPRKDGSRQPRRLCRACGRTFNQHTGTPLSYLKLRSQWEGLGAAMAGVLSVRRTAATLGIHRATAFRWRHRLLSALSAQPQPVLTGSVAASEAYVPYSEKGRRPPPDEEGASTAGQEASGDNGTSRRETAAQPRVRRFVDHKPACVLLACGGEQQAAVLTGRGRPAPAELRECLAQVLSAGANLITQGLAPFAEACRHLGIAHREPELPGGQFATFRQVEQLRGRLRGWLARFCGVATRYLHHYLVWLRFNRQIAGLRPHEGGQVLLTAANDTRPPATA